MNKNEKAFKIIVTSMTASADDFPGTPRIPFPYTLQPNEEKYVRINFPENGDYATKSCDRLKFEVKVTTEQYGGGTSDFRMAPIDEGEFTKFLHDFKPERTAEPGPLNIYAYTYPPATDWEYYKDKNFQVIIKIDNPKVDGTALIKNLILEQEFETTDRLFNIDCFLDTKIMEYIEDNDVKKNLCPNYETKEGNCIFFKFKDLNITKGDSEEIICEAKIDTSATLTGKYTDFINVRSDYDFVQEWDQSLYCLEI